MHERVAQSRLSCKEGDQVGTCDLHCCHVLYFDDRDHNGSRLCIGFLYREYDVGGPFEYMAVMSVNKDAMYLVPTLLFPISQWLTDGLLVSSVSNPVPQASNAVDHHFSCIVVMSFIL